MKKNNYIIIGIVLSSVLIIATAILINALNKREEAVYHNYRLDATPTPTEAVLPVEDEYVVPTPTEAVLPVEDEYVVPEEIPEVNINIPEIVSAEPVEEEVVTDVIPIISDCDCYGFEFKQKEWELTNVVSHDDYGSIAYYYKEPNSDFLACFVQKVGESPKFLEGRNMYGSDYSVIVFNNGIPSNNEDIYDAMYQQEIPFGHYVSDYTDGTTVYLTGIHDSEGEEYTVPLF